MSRSVPDRARHLAAELAHQFVHDSQLTTQLNDARQRPRRANDRLWWGLHPDAVAAVYGEHAAAVDAAFAHNRSEVLGAPDPLQALLHHQIHHAHCDYQAAAERRRELAAQVGELVHEIITTLVAAGWFEKDAREANVHNLANTTDEAPNEGTMW